MRPLPLLLLLAALSPAFASAQTITVDVSTRTVNTSVFQVQFDFSHQDEIAKLLFKPWSTTQSVGAYEGVSNEFWGQSLRGVDSTGFILPPLTEASDMTVTFQSATQIELAIEQFSTNQPVTFTTYRFFADQPFFEVTRTIEFAANPEVSSYQAYLARVPFLTSYRAVRYRSAAHALQQRVYAFQGILSADWDGRWLQQVEIDGTRGFATAVLYDTSTTHTHQFVRGYGPNSFTGWAAAYTPFGSHTQNETQRMLVYFSSDPSDTSTIDSLWTQWNARHFTLDAPAARAVTGTLRLAAAPNPARGTTQLDWTLPRAGRAELAVYDAAGRKVATLATGAASSGAHRNAWDGRDASGALAAPGVYLARLVTADAARTVRLVRLR